MQYGPDRAPYQVIQDASGDAAAQCFVNAGSAAVLEQYTLDPYGSAVTVEVFGPAPSLSGVAIRRPRRMLGACH